MYRPFTSNHYYFASTYGSGTYNNSTYNGETSTSTGTGNGSPGGTSGGSGSLVDTGFIVAVVVTAAALIIFVSLLVRFFRRPKEVTVEAELPADRTK